MTPSTRSDLRDVGILLIRLGIGGAFIAHGWPKVSHPESWAMFGSVIPFGNPKMWGCMAALAEFGGGILFAAGFLFRLVAAVLVFQMVMALKFHLTSQPPMNSWAMWSHAFEDGVIFLGMVLVGPGRFSVDHALFRQKDATTTAS